MNNLEYLIENIILLEKSRKYRTDNITTVLSRVIVEIIKKELDKGIEYPYQKTYGIDLEYPQGNYDKKILKFAPEIIKFINNITLKLIFLNHDMDFELGGGIKYKNLGIYIHMDIERFNITNEFIAELKNVIKHELEHSIRSIKSIFKPDEYIRSFGKTLSNQIKHYIQDEEINAYVVGLNKKAKTLKKPVEDIIEDYVDAISEIIHSRLEILFKMKIKYSEVTKWADKIIKPKLIRKHNERYGTNIKI